MNRSLALLILVFPLHPPVSGQVEEGVVPQDFMKVANRWMVSPEADKKKAAYPFWEQPGDEAILEYRRALEAARKHHTEAQEEAVGACTRGILYGDRLAALAISCKHASSEIRPFSLSLPEKSLAPKITTPSGISGKHTAIPVKAWDDFESVLKALESAAK